MYNSVLRVVAVVSSAAVLLLIPIAGAAIASPDSGGRCVGCHTATTGRQTTTPTTVNAVPGQPVAFTVQVTNAGVIGSPFAAAFTGKGTTSATFTSLDALPGDVNAANILVVPADAGWVKQSPSTKPYYTDQPVNGWEGSYSKTFSFIVPAGTPADTYHMVMKVAGSDGTGEWAQATDVFLNVGAVPEPATLAMLLGGALVGLVCWRGRKHTAAK